MASATLEVIISASDKFSGTANKVIGSLGRMDSSAKKVGKGFTQLGAGMARIGVVGAVAAAGGLTLIAKKTIEWETALAGVNKTVDFTTKDGLEKMGGELRKLATAIPITAVELAGLAEQAGALGIAEKDILSFTKTAALIGVTTDVSSDQAATSLGVLSNLLGLTGQDYSRFASALVDAGNKGASTEAQIIALTERMAGAGATAGFSADQLIGWASALANIGIEPEAGGSSFQKFVLSAMQDVAKGGEDLGVWARTAGVSARDFARAFNEDASGALERFLDGFAKLDKTKRLRVLDDLGLDDIRITRMLLGLAEAEKKTDNLTGALAITSTAWKSNTAAAEEADKRFGTVASKLQLLRNQFTEGALLIGEGFLPALGRVADKLGAVLSDPKSRNDLKQFGEDIGSFIDGINWNEAIEGGKTLVGLLKTGAQFAGSILSAINQLPTEVKAGALTFLAADKVSGGLLGKGLGNIGGGLLEVGTRSLGSRLPGSAGRVFAQPVFVTNWPAGGLLPGGGTAPGAAGATGFAALLKGALGVGLVVAAGLALKEVLDPGMFDPGSPASNMFNSRTQGPAGPGGKRTPVTPQLGMGPFGVGTPSGRSRSGSFGSNIPTTSRLAPEDRAALLASNKQRAAEFQSSQLAAHRDREHNTGVLRQVSTAASSVGTSIRGVTNSVASAIRTNRPNVDVDVTVNVTPRQITRATTTAVRYGPVGGSASRSPSRRIAL